MEPLLTLAQPLIAIALALLLDHVWGEPERHPLVLFGSCASQIEQWLNNQISKFRGVVALLIMLLPVAFIAGLDYLLRGYFWPSLILDILILQFVIGWHSMKEHVQAVFFPLLQNDLEAARRQLAFIVTRDTTNMSETMVVGSSIETTLENSNDCLFASIFWFCLLGPTGALLHRLVNTLDAMWGYKTIQYRAFGWAAARLDDVLGWLPARLTALSFACMGSFGTALTSWQKQASSHPSPAAGVVMAAGAGALKVSIGGNAIYHGKEVSKPRLGLGRPATAKDIMRCISLVQRAVLLWLVVIGAVLVIT